MPRGVYDRSKNKASAAVAVAVAEPPKAQAEPVNHPNNNVLERMAGGEIKAVPQVMGADRVTERLFPEFAPKAEPEQPKEEEPKEEPKAEVPTETPPVEAKETEPEDFIAANAEKKIKIKVDGKEEELTLAEMRTRVQLKEHWARTAEKIAQERKALAEERQKALEEKQRILRNASEGVETPETAANDIDARIQSAVEARLQQFMPAIAPVIYQTARQKVADELSAEGFGDFLDYVPKMSEHVAGLADDNLVRYYDTPEGAKALYFKLKLQDSRQAPQPTPPKQERVEPKPPVVKVDAGAASSTGIVDDTATLYRETFQKWKSATSSAERSFYFRQLLKLKEALPG